MQALPPGSDINLRGRIETRYDTSVYNLINIKGTSINGVLKKICVTAIADFAFESTALEEKKSSLISYRREKRRHCIQA